MQLQEIPGACVRTIVRAAEMPFNAINGAIQEEPTPASDESGMVLRLNELVANAKRVAGSLLADDELLEEGKQHRAVLDEIRQATEVSVLDTGRPSPAPEHGGPAQNGAAPAANGSDGTAGTGKLRPGVRKSGKKSTSKSRNKSGPGASTKSRPQPSTKQRSTKQRTVVEEDDVEARRRKRQQAGQRPREMHVTPGPG